MDYSSLDAVPNVCAANGEMESYDYLRDCISSLESKNPAGVGLTVAAPTNATDIVLRGDDLDDVNLSGIDFMKIESLLLQSTEEPAKEERAKDGSTDAGVPPSIRHFNTASLDFPNFPNCSSKESDNAATTVNTNESYTFGKDIQCLERKKMENYNCSAETYAENCTDTNSNINRDDSCLSQSITSDSGREVRIDNLQLADGEEPIQKCEQCLMTFRYKRHLDRHLEGHQKNNCPHCNEKFARRKHLEVHLFRAHGERVAGHPHLCDVCPKSFPKRALLNRHRAKHSYQSGKVCSECGDMMSADADEKEHQENHCRKRRFKCQQCLQTFSIEQTYLSHIQNHDNYKCPRCDVAFASKKKAREHFKAVHVPKSSEHESTNGPYFCADCRHTFAKKDDYFRHLQSALHLNKVNRDIPVGAVFPCAICSKKLITQRALDQHVRRIHKGAKRFACNIYGCTFQCARRTDLDRHKQLHVEERNVVCEHCGKTFTSVSILKDHVLYIHSKERQFICEECGKAFKRNSLLKRHKLSHEQHRPFACMQCSTAFKRSHHLTRHMETCHRITLEKKKKVMKLMKTKDGHLVPMPDKPVRPETNKIKVGKGRESTSKNKERDCSVANVKKPAVNVNSQLQIQPLLNPEEGPECPNLSLGLTNSSVDDSIPQVLSLVDVNTGQVLTVEITNNLELLPTNELVDQFGINCNEILNLPDYQDIEFQNSLLNTDQMYHDNTIYSEISLENIEGLFPLVNNNSKMETIESYLTHEFPAFLNI
ncbi:PREDICTED: zinc finger protein 93-like isoform X2 [Vollenhovia emeryi]|uniref:zinc finger protein 93-like isoform X2 n=1 Tax=Vollenhovia emeryi TaxID=411798 RepID=UPI0005F43B69|nr:PREDICTED: zinc finger protein 93-like isoform X2 [Vollenhovia emeryi]